MIKLDWYIGRAILSSVALVLLVLLGIQLLVSYISELEKVGRGDYDATSALYYVCLIMISRTYLVLPMATLLGALLGLGALAANNELVIMRAAGMSVARIARSVLSTCVVLIAFLLLLGEVVIPHTEQYARDMRANLMAKTSSRTLESGVWVKQRNDFVNIGRVYSDGAVADVTIYQYDGARLQRIVKAKNAQRNADEEAGWRLIDVVQTRFNAQGVQHIARGEMDWPELANLDALQSTTLAPEKHTMVSLFESMNYLKSNNLQSMRYEVAFWGKAALPFAIVVMLMIAMPIVFGPQRDSGAGMRVFLGSLIGLGFYLTQQLLTYLGQVVGMPAFLSAFAAVLLFGAASVVLLRRVF